MIECLMIISKTGILRFIKIFSENELSLNKEALLESTINYIRSSNDTQIIYDFPYNNSNKKLVYRIFGGIYIVMIVDDLENELAILDFINVIMKALDEVFGGICELHIILNPEKIYLLIDEAICGGMVIETNKNEIIKNYNSKFKEDEGYKIIPGLF